MNKMERVLVVVLDDGELDRMQDRFPSPSKKMNHLAVDGSMRSGSPRKSDLDLLHAEANELSQFSCDCQIATCLPEAEALLAEQHFDSVIFDLAVFDGKEHHLLSQLSGSAASLFSRLDFEDSCWWFPTGIVGKESWELKSERPTGSRPVLHELLRQLASGTLQNPSREAALSTTHTPFAGQGGRNVRVRSIASHKTGAVAAK
jgi:hypothetical protein